MGALWDLALLASSILPSAKFKFLRCINLDHTSGSSPTRFA